MNAGLYGQQGTTPIGVTLFSSGQVIPAVPGKRIRVFAWFASTLLATQIKFQSGANDISGLFSCSEKGGHVVPHVDLAWMITEVSEALNLNMSINTTVGLQVIYDIF